MGFGYPFPDLKIHDVGKVLEADRPVMAALAVPRMEVYLLMDPDFGDPKERFDRFLELYREMQLEIASRGYEWVVADIPPEVEKSFGRRLKKLGWYRTEWANYATKVN